MKAQDLKNSILQLAIQGKLVSQDENDEPAEVLYAKIQAEKQKLIKEGKIKKDKPLPPITEDEIPFSIPLTWKWVRLGSIFNHNTGKALNTSKQSGKYHKYLTTSNVYWNSFNLDIIKEMKFNAEELEKYTVSKGDLLVCEGGDVGRAAIWNYEHDICIQNHIHKLRAFYQLEILFFYYIFMSYKYSSRIDGKGIGIKGLSSNVLHNLIIPLPPLEEQKRIVVKIEELEPLINQYNQAEQELSTLNDKFPEQLKKSILQYAIQGKLVSQDETDEPAEVLYAKIQAEKQKLIKEGKIKKDKPLPPITEDEIPFSIPPTWKWVRLGEIVKYIQRGKSPEYTDIKKVPVISQKCNQWNGLDISSVKFITERSLYNYNQERYLLTDDLLLNSTGTGTVGRVGIYYENLNPYHIAVADSHVTVVRPLWVSSKYLYNFFASPYIQLNIENLCDGSTNQIELALQTVKKILIPLPPLEEQHRIVAKVEELLQQCNKMNQLSV